MWVLQVLGMAVLLLVLLVGLAVLLFRFVLPWWFKRKWGDVQALSKFDVPMPVRITPQRGKFTWQQANTERLMQQMKALGYLSAGRYQIPEIPSLLIWAGVHPDNHSLAIVHDHERFSSFDLLKLDVHHNAYGVSTSLTFDPSMKTPDSVALPRPELSPKEAFDLMQSIPLKHAPLKVVPDSFKRALMTMHARQMEAVLSGPLPTAESVQAAQVRASKAFSFELPELSEAQQVMALQIEQSKFLDGVYRAMLARYVEDSQIAAEQWQHLSEDVVVVHEHLDDEAVCELALSQSETAADEPHIEAAMRLPGSAIEKFQRVQALLPSHERLHALADVRLPLHGRLYVNKNAVGQGG